MSINTKEKSILIKELKNKSRLVITLPKFCIRSIRVSDIDDHTLAKEIKNIFTTT